MDLPENYLIWKKQMLPKHLAEQLAQMSREEIIEAFTSNLEFGTAGMRGTVGPGTSRINEVTIIKATTAVVEYLKTQFSKEELKERGVVIAHDNRHFSKEFALLTAQILAHQGVLAYLFKDNDLRPTPVLSYSIRKINAVTGIVITASHNPPEYNGYKIYDQNGCQFLPDVTNIIADNMLKLKDQFEFNFSYDETLIKEVPLAIEEQYRNDIKSLQFYPNEKRNIKIVFSNLHGTSREWVLPILKECGYEVIIVKEQADYDPDFKGVVSPNPEIKATFGLAIKYAKENDADLVILNDPDADRIGIAVKHQGKYVLLNGNETAPILLEYLLSHYQKSNTMPKNPVMYNTFVTGTLSDQVAKSYDCQVIKTLTGFKWIGAEILKEKQRGINFVFGFEEAYGYVIKDITRDKDGIQAAMVLAEACWYYLQQSKTLIDVLTWIYQKFGYYYCYTVNLVLKGQSGQKQIASMIDILRKEDIKSLAQNVLEKKEDYLNGLYNMPGQNLLKFYFQDGSWFAVRPSGTEPKIKFYFVCIDNSIAQAKAKMHNMYHDLAENYLKLTVTKEQLNDD
ncbi:phospho-sugar mutase [Spiroplasma platyhelix]|uniref:Phospho-sugar mutase n=1 Tax=Spiroplasma platyhelix PALS-1 TaxID=1276218 RepID=A0A846UD37_9MOLU|nr:phospho-sugar mutase [Spiroplasma platyhelix]MBE4704058.1 Phosphoglucomutase [Spiroplasma platyhelix PALS-1]NKE38428.1 phospho-sugar mutase [Spiroplasma platyhelix PALS-1]UJB29316.1 phosphoglucomutase/phosphomannomutase [Spiroplasma platyhelix PALS-1]